MKKNGIILLLAGVLSLVAGAGIGRWTGERPRGAVSVRNQEVTEKKVLSPQGKQFAGKVVARRGNSVFSEWEFLMNKLYDGVRPDEFPTLMAEIKDRENLKYLLEKWAQVSPRLAVLEVEKKYGRDFELLRPVFYAWMARDPREVAQFYMENRDRYYAEGNMLVDGVIRRWSRNSPDEAWAWLNSVSLDKSENEYSRVNFYTTLMESHPERLKDFAGFITEDEKNYKSLAEHVAKVLYKEDGAKALEWIKSQPAEMQYLAEVVQAVEKPAEPAPKTMAELISKMESLPKEEQNNFAYYISRQDLMALADTPRQAMDFILSYRIQNYVDGMTDSHPWALQEIVDKNLPDVRQWINELPNGQKRDVLVDMYLSRDFSLSAEEKVWLGASTSPNYWRIDMGELISEWAKESPEKAKEWVKNSSYPEEKKEEWLAGIGR